MAEYFTTKEVAQLWKVSERTIRNLCYENKLMFDRIGNQIRISDEHIKEYLLNQNEDKEN